MNKQKRHKIIKELISINEIINQDMLLDMLLAKGLVVTQATLSRDIKELKIIKQHTESGGYKYILPQDNIDDKSVENTALTSFGFINIEFSGQFAIIKTKPGYAMAIAGEIDNKATETVLGTVAGDDTILIIPREGVSREQIVKSLGHFIPNLN